MDLNKIEAMVTELGQQCVALIDAINTLKAQHQDKPVVINKDWAPDDSMRQYKDGFANVPGNELWHRVQEDNNGG